MSEDPERSSYEDLELGTLTSYFSFRPPSPRPPGSTPPQQQKNPQNSQKRQEGSAGTNRQFTGARVDTTQRPTKVDTTVSDSTFLLSPSIIRALEGVHYIADHLRAEDADFSVSINEIPHLLNVQLSEWCFNGTGPLYHCWPAKVPGCYSTRQVTLLTPMKILEPIDMEYPIFHIL